MRTLILFTGGALLVAGMAQSAWSQGLTTADDGRPSPRCLGRKSNWARGGRRRSLPSRTAWKPCTSPCCRAEKY